MAIKYLHKNAANIVSAAHTHAGQVSFCHARTNNHRPTAKKNNEPVSRVAIRETKTAGPRNAKLSAEASPTPRPKMRVANPYTAPMIAAPIAAANSRTATIPPKRFAHAAKMGHRYHPKL